MSYCVEVIKKGDQGTNAWSGGTTTELAIYPKGASYSERNFKWRLSSAKVETEESTFTYLKGTWRLIMSLEGELDLDHEAHHKIHLKAFQQDSFSGEWTTKSYGKVRDFNLMMAQGVSGQIVAVHLNSKETFKVPYKSGVPYIRGESYISKEFNLKETKYITEAFYCVKGKVFITINEKEKINLNTDDILLVNTQGIDEELDIFMINDEDEKVSVVRASIFY